MNSLEYLLSFTNSGFVILLCHNKVFYITCILMLESWGPQILVNNVASCA